MTPTRRNPRDDVPTAPSGTPAREPAPISEEVEMEENGKPLHDQPELRMEERKNDIVLDQDKALLTAREAMTISMAFPYAGAADKSP